VRTSTFLVGLMLPVLATGVHGQDLSSLAPDTRVRVTTLHHPRWQLGVTSSARVRDTLTLYVRASTALTRQPLAIPLANLLRVDQYTGRRNHWMTGAALGTVLGGVAAFLVVRSTLCSSYARSDGGCSGVDVPITLLGAGGGGILGGLLGLVSHSDKWTRLALPPM
jgi:hypothetical protein